MTNITNFVMNITNLYYASQSSEMSTEVTEVTEHARSTTVRQPSRIPASVPFCLGAEPAGGSDAAVAALLTRGPCAPPPEPPGRNYCCPGVVCSAR